MIGPRICPGFCSVARVVYDRRPSGKEDPSGLYRVTSVPEKVGMKLFYKPAEDFSKALADRNGQKSIQAIFTDSQLENARKNHARTTHIRMDGTGFVLPNGMTLMHPARDFRRARTSPIV